VLLARPALTRPAPSRSLSGRILLAAGAPLSYDPGVMPPNFPDERGRLMRRLLLILTLGLLAAAAVPAWADVLIERYSRSDGLAGMGAFENTTVQATAATAQREESHLKFSGGFLSAVQKMAGIGASIRITRLDRDLVWAVDPEKKTYTESPLTARGERERPGPGQPRPGDQRPKDKGEPSDVVITKNEFKVEKTGASKTINGFPCEEYLMTWLVETKNTKTGETGKSLMTNRLWTTPETAQIRAAQAEEQEYSRAYLKKIGLDVTPAEAQKFLAGLRGVGEEDQQKALARLGGELSKVRGFTIVSDLSWAGEGSGGEAKEGGAPRSGGGQPGVTEMMGQLGKLFGGGPKKGASDPAASGGEEKKGSLFSLYTEVKSIRTVPADPTRFEVPAGFTLKK
jgi:hypothetical protein